MGCLILRALHVSALEPFRMRTQIASDPKMPKTSTFIMIGQECGEKDVGPVIPGCATIASSTQPTTGHISYLRLLHSMHPVHQRTYDANSIYSLAYTRIVASSVIVPIQAGASGTRGCVFCLVSSSRKLLILLQLTCIQAKRVDSSIRVA